MKDTKRKMKTKTISFIPSPELEQNIDQITRTLRTSKAGLSELSIEFVTNELLNGRAKVVNGKIEIAA